MTVINNLVILTSIAPDRYEYFALKKDAYMDCGKMVMPVGKYLKHLSVLLDAKEKNETLNPKTK